MYDLLIIGGGPAGLSAAMTARNRNLSVCVICGGAADSALYKAGRVTNYPGVPAVSGPALLETMTQQARDLGADMLRERALSAMPMGKTFGVSAGKEFVEGRALLLATGIAQRGTFPGETDYLGRGVSYCATCDGMLYRDRPVAAVVLGAGFDEDVRFLQGICQVDVLTRPPRALRAEGERVILSTSDSDTAYDCVFILRPAVALTTLLPALETADGAVRVDADMQTNIPGVFAAGDITGAPYQAARAVGQGNTAALSIARFLHQGDAINHESTN